MLGDNLPLFPSTSAKSRDLLISVDMNRLCVRLDGSSDSFGSG